LAGLRSTLRTDIPIEEVPYHISDEAFARVAANAMLTLCGMPAPVGT
jgi:hypothetical protein